MTQGNRLLIVEDQPETRDLVAMVAEEVGYETAIAEPPERLLDIHRQFAPTVIVLDLMMPAIDGVQALRALAEAKCGAVVVLLSAVEPRVLDAAARLAESYGLRLREAIRKPVAVEALHAALARHRVWSPILRADDLAEALRGDGIDLRLEPRLALSPDGERSVAGGQAVPYLRHPEFGEFGPDHVRPLAESAGLASRLAERVLHRALRHGRRLADLGYSIAVWTELPPSLLNEPRLPDLVAGAVAEHGVEPRNVCLAVTESSALGEPSAATETLTRLRLTGVRLSIADFGVGPSSLARLYRLPFDELTIDRSVVAEIAWCERARAFAKSVVELAHGLGMTVCAAGVDRAETLDFLASVGCDGVEGYAVGAPLPPPEFVDLLARGLYRRSAAVVRRLARP